MVKRLKGLAQARRGARLLTRAGLPIVSREAEEHLFATAEVLSEGSIRDAKTGAAYYGSTMITFDLESLAKIWRGPFTDRERGLLLEAVQGSVRFRVRAMRLACEEVARRVPDRPLGTAQVETRIHLSGEKLHVDVDLEVPVGVSSRRSER